MTAEGSSREGTDGVGGCIALAEGSTSATGLKVVIAAIAAWDVFSEIGPPSSGGSPPERMMRTRLTSHGIVNWKDPSWQLY